MKTEKVLIYGGLGYLAYRYLFKKKPADHNAEEQGYQPDTPVMDLSAVGAGAKYHFRYVGASALRLDQNGQPIYCGIPGEPFSVQGVEGKYATVGSAPTHTCPTLDVATKHATTSVVLNGNGFFSVQVPSSYSSSQEYITFSVNIDYLRDVVRLRGGDTGMNLPSSYGITLSKGSSSGGGAFPMGMRRYADMGGIADERAAYYAPRLHIVKDVKWVPATTITYTDTHIDMSSESLVVKDVRWSQSGREVEKVQLGLEKIEDHYAYNLVAALRKPPRDPPKPSQGRLLPSPPVVCHL